MPLKHREVGYALLSGSGFEIGALHEPATLPSQCNVSYFDALSREEAEERFPELDKERLVRVDRVGDIDKRELRSLGEAAQDFLVANHVIEHVACPIAMIEDLFFILRPGGRLAISAPDKRFTFDKERAITSFEHLQNEYREGVDTVDDSHYLDFLKHVGKHVFNDPGRDIEADIAFVRSRREHAHVWDSAAFENFLTRCQDELGIRFEIEYHSAGDENSIEYFCILKKQGSP